MRQTEEVLIEDYRIPPGYYDLPYIYAFNGDALTDGIDYSHLRVPVGDGADFYMRRAAGMQTIAGRIQIRDDYAPFFGTPNGVVMTRDWPVVPEKRYNIGSDVSFDLFTVARAFNAGLADIVYYPQLIFQGVRRFVEQIPRLSPKPYHEKTWTYDFNLNLTWAGTDPQPRRFYIPIFDHDFELHRMTAYRYERGRAPSFAVPFAEFRLLLFDSSPRQLMSTHINDFFVLDNADANSMQYNSVFPVPTVIYPVGGVITFEIVSLLTNNNVPSQYQICFHGVKRILSHA